MKLHDLVGWIGTFTILTGYGLLALNLIQNDYRYHGLMLFGSIGVAFLCYKHKTWQPFVLNICFAAFAVVALITH